MAPLLLSALTGHSCYVGDGSSSIQGDYDLENARVLGTGMAGSVRSAIHRMSGQTYAVKSYTKSVLKPSMLQDLKSEVEIQLALRHPCIAQLHRVYETEAEIHLVLEHLRGGEAFERVVSRGRCQEADAAEALYHMLAAVAHVHEQGYGHFDVKLENFVFEDEAGWRAKLIDFGFAKELGGQLSRICGSAQTMAPEVLRGSYDEAADVWSLGVVAYMMLCGNSPWAHSALETQRMIYAGRPAYRADFYKLSSGAQDFVRSLLTCDPRKRPSAKDMLGNAWLLEHTKQSSLKATPPCDASSDDRISAGATIVKSEKHAASDESEQLFERRADANTRERSRSPNGTLAQRRLHARR